MKMEIAIRNLGKITVNSLMFHPTWVDVLLFIEEKDLKDSPTSGIRTQCAYTKAGHAQVTRYIIELIVKDGPTIMHGVNCESHLNVKFFAQLNLTFLCFSV